MFNYEDDALVAINSVYSPNVHRWTLVFENKGQRTKDKGQRKKDRKEKREKE